MCSLSWILCSVLYIFHKLKYCRFLTFSTLCNLLHNISDQTLVEILWFFVSLKSWINFHFNHFWKFFSYLNLLSFEIIDIVPNIVLSFCNFSSQIDFLLVSSELLLLNPAIDGSKLVFHALLETHDRFIFSLEFSFDDRVHCTVPVSHFISFILRFLSNHLILNINLIFNIFNLSVSFFLFKKKSIYQICHFKFKSSTEIYLDLTNNVFEFFTVFQIWNF